MQNLPISEILPHRLPMQETEKSAEIYEATKRGKTLKTEREKPQNRVQELLQTRFLKAETAPFLLNLPPGIHIASLQFALKARQQRCCLSYFPPFSWQKHFMQRPIPYPPKCKSSFCHKKRAI